MNFRSNALICLALLTAFPALASSPGDGTWAGWDGANDGPSVAVGDAAERNAQVIRMNHNTALMVSLYLPEGVSPKHSEVHVRTLGIDGTSLTEGAATSLRVGDSMFPEWPAGVPLPSAKASRIDDHHALLVTSERRGLFRHMVTVDANGGVSISGRHQMYAYDPVRDGEWDVQVINEQTALISMYGATLLPIGFRLTLNGGAPPQSTLIVLDAPDMAGQHRLAAGPGTDVVMAYEDSLGAVRVAMLDTDVGFGQSAILRSDKWLRDFPEGGSIDLIKLGGARYTVQVSDGQGESTLHIIRRSDQVLIKAGTQALEALAYTCLGKASPRDLYVHGLPLECALGAGQVMHISGGGAQQVFDAPVAGLVSDLEPTFGCSASYMTTESMVRLNDTGAGFTAQVLRP